MSRPLHHQSCQVLFGLPTRAVPSTTNHARSCLACQQEPSPPPPIMPGLVWPANRSRPLHHQSCQVLFGLPTRAVPSTTNHVRSCLVCRHEPSPPPPIMPGLLWPVNRSRPFHHQSCLHTIAISLSFDKCWGAFGVVEHHTTVSSSSSLWPMSRITTYLSTNCNIQC